MAQQIVGDGSIIAQVTATTGQNAWTRSGIMIRSALDPGSPHVSLFITPGEGVAMDYRATDGKTSTNVTGPDFTVPYW